MDGVDPILRIVDGIYSSSRRFMGLAGVDPAKRSIQRIMVVCQSSAIVGTLEEIVMLCSAEPCECVAAMICIRIPTCCGLAAWT